MHRNSLRECVKHAASLYENTESERLIIIDYPKAKYYAVMTMSEFAAAMESEPDLGQRIIMNCTKREFYHIVRSDQYNLFPGENDGNPS